jgi:putative restriction endonuclease
MAERINWTRDQLLMALRLYMRLPFGKLHGKNPEIIQLAAKIGRTSNALAMKACNFASIDPKLNRKGLSGASQADRNIWQEFEGNPTQLALEAEDAAERLNVTKPAEELDWQPPRGATEKESMVKVRRVQGFFRAAVMVSYEGKCAVTGLAVPELLVASHIIPWSADESRRADPTNGLLLNALLDKAFDRGLIGFDDDLRVIVSKVLLKVAKEAALDSSLLQLAGRKLRLPGRFKPDINAIHRHRINIFKL